MGAMPLKISGAFDTSQGADSTASCLISNPGNSANTDSIFQAKEDWSYPWNKQTVRNKQSFEILQLEGTLLGNLQQS